MMKCKTKWRKCCCVNLFSISGSRHHSFTHLHCGSALLMDICLKWKQEVFIHHAAVMASAGPWCLLHGCISVIYELTNCFCPDVFLWSDHLLSAKVISCAFFFFFLSWESIKERVECLVAIIGNVIFHHRIITSVNRGTVRNCCKQLGMIQQVVVVWMV